MADERKCPACGQRLTSTDPDDVCPSCNQAVDWRGPRDEPVIDRNDEKVAEDAAAVMPDPEQ